MKTVSLFSGIGGFDLGLQNAGHEIIMQVEIDPRARQCLQAHFRGVCLQHSVEALWELPPDTELLCAGFPCQDVSHNSPSRAGMRGSRTSLVEHVFRLLSMRRVPFVVLENVPGALSPISVASASKGASSAAQQQQDPPLMRHLADRLEGLGYRWAYRVVDTRAFGIPHRRRRVFLVALLYGDPRDVLLSHVPPFPSGPPATASSAAHGPGCACAACVDSAAAASVGAELGPTAAAATAVAAAAATAVVPAAAPRAYTLDLSCWNRGGDADVMGTLTTQNAQRTMLVVPQRCPPVGMLSIRDAERLQGFPADWTLPCQADGKGRQLSAEAQASARFGLVGNAVSVPVAEWLGRALLQPLASKYASAPADKPLSAWQQQQSGHAAGPSSSWPRAAWGGASEGRHAAAALLASPAAELPLLAPLQPLDAFLGPFREGGGPRPAEVLQYAEKMRDARWELAADVRAALVRVFKLQPHHFFLEDLPLPGRRHASRLVSAPAGSASRSALVWALCPTYKPRYWPAVLLPQQDWPQAAGKTRKAKHTAVVRFMDGSWLWVSGTVPYEEHCDEMEAQLPSTRWADDFRWACNEAHYLDANCSPSAPCKKRKLCLAASAGAGEPALDRDGSAITAVV